MNPYTQTCKCWLTNKNTYNRSVWTQNVVSKTYQKRWMIEMNGEWESGKSMPAARHDDDDDDDENSIDYLFLIDWFY